LTTAVLEQDSAEQGTAGQLGAVAASIVIATRNRRDLLARTLRSLEQLEPGCSFEVIVVDHGSTDRTAELIAASPLPIRRLEVPFTHESIADPKNAGARAARADLLVFLDSGMVCPPSFVKAHIEAHRAQPTQSIVGGAVVGWDCEDDDGDYWRAVDAGQLTPVPAHLADERPARWPTCTETLWMLVWGANMSVSRRAFLDGGGFDTAMRGWGWDDLELVFRLERHGVRPAFSEQAWAVHYPHPRASLPARLAAAEVNWLHAYDRHRCADLETWESCGYWEHTDALRGLRRTVRSPGWARSTPPARDATTGERVLFGFAVADAPDPRDTYIVAPGSKPGAARAVESFGLRTALPDSCASVAIASPNLLDLDWNVDPGWKPLAVVVLRELARLAARVELMVPATAPAARIRLGELVAVAGLTDVDIIDEEP
jgi:GT2 family glycosyltransferase